MCGYTLITVLLTVVFVTFNAPAGELLTYVDLINRLTDLEQLAVLPAPGENCRQWSSYDRKSRYDEKTGKYLDWGAGSDYGQYIRREGDQEIMAEMEGPGVIWRIWSANAGEGRVAIYLDGAKEPAVDHPFREYFGGKAPFNRGALCYALLKGFNCYLPVPYQKSCKIVSTGKSGSYYHFTCTSYPKGTILPTFQSELSPGEAAALDKANAFLENQCGIDPAGARAGEKTETKSVTVKPGETVRIIDLKGPRAITALRIQLDLPAALPRKLDRLEPPMDMAVLRELCLQITWDDEPTPAVWSPLGDFFGTAPGVNKYRSLPLGMTEEGFYSFWYMPFGKRALVELVNDGQAPQTVTFKVTYAPLSRPIEKLGRFHAKWHREAFMPEEPARKEGRDWTMLKTQGCGRFVGVMLHVWNPRGGWWGEGDEKFFVDGEKFPSTFGTGSEDYFGYAWCDPRLFSRAYHSQTRNDGWNMGHVSVNRWHINDNVPFQTSFEAAIEKCNEDYTLYAVVAYWYLAPGGTDAYPLIPAKDRIGFYHLPPSPSGLLEAERLWIIEVEMVEPNAMSNRNCSDGYYLWWRAGRIGQKSTVALPIEVAGKYRVLVQPLKASVYGIVEFYLDDRKLGNAVDLYGPGKQHYPEPAEVLDGGIHDLTRGEHRLTVKVVGANEKAKKPSEKIYGDAYSVGLDYIKLVPVN